MTDRAEPGWKAVTRLSWWMFWRMVVAAILLKVIVGTVIMWGVGAAIDALDLQQLTTARLVWFFEFLIQLGIWFVVLTGALIAAIGVKIKGRRLEFSPVDKSAGEV